MEERRQNARLEMNDVRARIGRITPMQKAFMSKNDPQLLKTVLSMQAQLGKSANILAGQVYTTDSRFVYELIQNAEDNSYSDDVTPSLSLTLEQDRIIIDSNERGFQVANIEAICKIGDSTKSGKREYIGEKGIGFKSVFSVAHKVHVQSEPYSFSFEHHPGDDGLGMLTPLDENHGLVPVGTQTRIILHLREDCSRAERRQEFLNLPDTLLLFLKNLKQLSINIELPEYPQKHTTYRLESQNANTGDLENRVFIEKRDGQSVTRYHFWKKEREIGDMPFHEARKDNITTKVVLAFPLDANETPLCEPQLIYAFLPLRNENFKFLIQSDFVTTANREDVTRCPWNIRLRQEVVKTFLHAIKNGFLHHPTLRYSWVRYIPTTSNTHAFWGELQSTLVKEICARKLFVSLADETSPSQLWEPGQVRIVTEMFRDKHSIPLLADLPSGDTAYISEKYDAELDLPVMKQLGTRNMAVNPDFLARLKEDLDNNDASRWKSEDLEEDDWHTKVCDILLNGLRNPPTMNIVLKLDIIPLEGDGPKWDCKYKHSIFFPSSGGVEIPGNLLAGLVKQSWLRNNSRKTLCIKLGITECPPTEIFPLIEQRYVKSSSISTYLLYEDIKFLFWHNRQLPAIGYSLYLAVDNGAGRRGCSNTNQSYWLYCPESGHPYSTFKILNGKVPTELQNRLKFPDIHYFEILKKCGQRNNMNGPDWLRDRGNIKVTPQLRRRGGAIFGRHEMSEELLYIMGHLPQYLLGVLESDWLNYVKSDEWDARIKAIQVPILNSTDSRTLEKTFLPLPKLKAIVDGLELGQSFGFLKELDGMTDVELVKWRFLEHFGVGMADDVSFWIALLEHARTMDGVEKHQVFKIYSRLQTFIDAKDVALLRQTFESSLTYVPMNSSASPEWICLEDCVWSGPEWFSYLQCLRRVSEYQQLYGLYVNTLGLKDAGLDDYLDYLEHIKDSEICRNSKEEESKISLIYKALNELAVQDRTNAAKAKIRARFDEDELVYCPRTQSWESPANCIWAEDHIQLPEKLSLATSYKNQATFFQAVLGIEKPSLEMHIHALSEKALFSPDKYSIQQEMRNICALNPKPDDLRPKLSSSKCFQVRKPSGEVEWSSCSGAFAVVDRTDYGNLFRDKIATLDFSLEEVHSIKAFLQGLKLEPKYLSNAVKEETRVEGGVFNAELTNDLRRKAYAIARYAGHLGVPDITVAYSMLQNLEVYSSDSISNVLSITLDESIAIPGEAAYFHIAQEGSQLTLYVPKHKRDQQICLARQLPIKLLEHLGVQRAKQAAALASIITASSLYVVDTLLEQDGIIEVPGIDRPEAEADDDTVAPPSPLPNPATPSPTRTPYSERSTSYFSEGRLFSENLHPSDDPFLTPATSVSSTSPSYPVRSDRYRELLDIVIQHAESTPSLPSEGESILSSDASDSTIDRYLAIRSSISGEENFLIGAAGELFVSWHQSQLLYEIPNSSKVFELLRNLSLPEFDISCWKSTIRQRVAVHSRYTGLARWNGSETADIVYSDAESALTSQLIRLGYLGSSAWSCKTPTYYIEVKATMGALENPLFCSQSQVDRMEQMQLPDLGPSNNVYLIARVFGLSNSKIGLHLYLDPAKLRREERLKFVADKYIVTPC